MPSSATEPAAGSQQAAAGSRQDPATDEGSAVVEFVALGTLLLVPVVYFVLAVAQVQAGAFAVVAAAQQASQVLARAEPGQLSEADLSAAAQLAAADQGFAPEQLVLRLECSDGGCAAAGAVATVHGTLEVPLPLVPGFTDLEIAVLTSSATVVLGRYG